MNEINRPDAWLSSTLSALRAIAQSRYDDATSLWRDACAFADRLPNNDPRRAAALSNLGLSQFIAGDREQAVAALGAARDHWQIVEAWVQQVDIPSTASSSMFHFLLAANHPDALAQLRRKKYLTLCTGAAAITDSIYDYAREGTAEPDRMRKHIQSIQAAFGEDATEAKSVEERWRSVSKNTVVEMRPLVDAAYLTVGLTTDDLNRAHAHRG